jgi:FAD/FMN-containing dehydrogenase
VAVEHDPLKQEQLWRIRHASATVATHTEGNRKALPVIDDGIVPPEKLHEFVDAVYELFRKHHLRIALWGHAGDANIHMQPFLDLSQVGDRQTMSRLMEEYYDLVISLGGSTTGEYNDGRLRGPYLEKLYGAEMYQLLTKVKQIFDPYGTLNPGVKINVTHDDVKPLLRTNYKLSHLFDHLPRS